MSPNAAPRVGRHVCTPKIWRGLTTSYALRLLMGEIRNQTMFTCSCAQHYKLALYHMLRACSMLQCYITSLQSTDPITYHLSSFRDIHVGLLKKKQQRNGNNFFKIFISSQNFPHSTPFIKQKMIQFLTKTKVIIYFTQHTH
jgi:hypothetical protein